MQLLQWDDIYSEAELYKTAVRLYTKPLFNWRKALSTSNDDRTLYDFARNGLKNIHKIHNKLSARKFEFRSGTAIHHNFNGKKRTLYVYPWEERLVDLLLYRMLNRQLHSTMSNSSYAYRTGGRGIDSCQRRLAQVISSSEVPLYVVKRDISDYFASIDHSILLDSISDIVDPDDYLFKLLQQRIRFSYSDDGKSATAEQGIPFGTAIACVLSNIYLFDLDRKLEDVPDLKFFRYADDILAISTSRESALKAQDIINREFERLKLSSKPSHELNFALHTAPVKDDSFQYRSHFRHLGLDFRADGSVGLSRDKIRKIRNLFRYAFRRRNAGFRRLHSPEQKARLAIKISRDVLEKGVRNVAIIDYYLRHIQDEKQLKLIDRWLAEEVLSRAFGGGHKKGYFRLISFKELRSWGLPSLLHRHRQIKHGHIKSSFFLWKNSKSKLRSGEKTARPNRPSPHTQKQQDNRLVGESPACR